MMGLSRMGSHAKSVSRPNAAGCGFAKGGSRPSYPFSSDLIHPLCLFTTERSTGLFGVLAREAGVPIGCPALGNALAAACSTEDRAKKLAAGRGLGGHMPAGPPNIRC
jgi:hypothetical protein